MIDEIAQAPTQKINVLDCFSMAMPAAGDMLTRRRAMREQWTLLFLKEAPGTGNKERTSKYHYRVERAAGGEVIVLQRPARLNKGFDFTVHVANADGTPFYFTGGRRTDKPAHSHIIHAVRDALATAQADIVRQTIDKLYRLEPVNLTSLHGVTLCGWPADVVMLCIKWLFLEQDITYWNTSGRAMLYNAIREVMEKHA